MRLSDIFKSRTEKIKVRDKELFEKSERFHEVFTELTHRHKREVTLKQYDKLRRLVANYPNFNLIFVRKINNRVSLKDLDTDRIIDIFEIELRK